MEVGRRCLRRKGSTGFGLCPLGTGLAVLPFVLLWTVLIAVVPEREHDA